MFPDYTPRHPSRQQVHTEMAAHGLSIVEMEHRPKQGWHYNRCSNLNRRVTGETLMELSGPAAGHGLLKVSYDRTGILAFGTLGNSGGAKTPWDTFLSCEGNFQHYFANQARLSGTDARKASHDRYHLPAGSSERGWELHDSRFDLAKEPNEPFRFGWVVEIDPYNPGLIPQKRTALGRARRRITMAAVSQCGRAVVYSSDEGDREYLYKFVSSSKVSPDRAANWRLLDRGTLYVARLDENGGGEWLPLIAGRDSLARWTQAEVLINARGAADSLGATRMERPAAIDLDAANGKFYCVMAGERGHIIEFAEQDNNAAADCFTWKQLTRCPDKPHPAMQDGCATVLAAARAHLDSRLTS